MKASSPSRLIAVVLLAIPVAWGMSRSSQRSLNQIATDPAGYLQHARSIQHIGFLYQFVVALILLGAMAFVVEGLAQLIGRLLPEKRDQAQKRSPRHERLEGPRQWERPAVLPAGWVSRRLIIPLNVG
jgi:hypothetical protein